MLKRSLWPIDMTLSGATTSGQNESRSDGNEGVLRIPQSSSITEASPSDCFVLYQGHSLGRSKSFDGKAPVLDIWGILSTPSLPLLPDPLWPGVVAPESVQSVGQIERFNIQTLCKQMTSAELIC